MASKVGTGAGYSFGRNRLDAATTDCSFWLHSCLCPIGESAGCSFVGAAHPLSDGVGLVVFALACWLADSIAELDQLADPAVGWVIDCSGELDLHLANGAVVHRSSQPWLVLLLVLGLLPWLVTGLRHWSHWGVVALLVCSLSQAVVQMGDGFVVVHQRSRQWLLARHRGRAVLVSTHGDGRSCWQARRLSEAFGHARLDWAMVLDPVASEAASCWRNLAHTVLAEHQGVMPLQVGQRLVSPGLEGRPIAEAEQSLQLRAGRLRWHLLPTRQAYWSWRDRQGLDGMERQPLVKSEGLTGVWLGFVPTSVERRWLLQHTAGRLWVSGRASGSFSMVASAF